MADLMQSATSWLVDQLADNLSQTVTYTRGGLSVSLAATKSTVRAESAVEVNVDFQPCDWIIKASALILGGETVEPQKNDTITESDGQVWLVLPLETEPEFRYLDQYRTAYRVHTKRETEAN